MVELKDENIKIQRVYKELKKQQKEAGAMMGIGGAADADPDYVQLKFGDWKQKMICPSCKTREVEKFLMCGHLSCAECVGETFKSRQRCCATCRRRLTKQDVIQIYWNSNAE